MAFVVTNAKPSSLSFLLDLKCQVSPACAVPTEERPPSSSLEIFGPRYVNGWGFPPAIPNGRLSRNPRKSEKWRMGVSPWVPTMEWLGILLSYASYALRNSVKLACKLPFSAVLRLRPPKYVADVFIITMMI